MVSISVSYTSNRIWQKQNTCKCAYHFFVAHLFCIFTNDPRLIHPGQFLTVTVYDSGAASGVAPTIIPTTIAPTTVNETEVDVPVTLPADISNETLTELDDIETMLELDENATFPEDDDNTTLADEPEETPEEPEADPTQINSVEAASSGRANSVPSAVFLLGASLMLLVV